MTENSPILCCVGRGTPPPELQQLTEKLGAMGRICRLKTLPGEGLPQVEWFTNLEAGATSFLFFDNDPLWMKLSVQALRMHPHAKLAAIFWALESQQTGPTKSAIEAGVDDLLVLTEPAEVVSLRLALREREAAARAAVDRVFKEQAANLAKADTALKQREEFLGVCAHDLRSPLGLIQSSLSLLIGSEQGKSLNEFQTELLNRCRRQAGHALMLVNDLLDVMALEQGLKPQYRILRLDELLADFYKDYRFQAEQKKVAFHYENPITDWRVLADSERVRQLLSNLFTNALKFTEPGKNIWLTVQSFRGRRKGDPAHPMLVIGVKDEGRGIPSGEIQKIFNRFTQIKDYSRAEGRGLGLTVAKQISTLHDGNIWVQSVEGQGSTFFVLFPHVISRTEAGELNRTVVVAEASTTKQSEYFSRLKAWGYDVAFAKDGVEAITLMYHLWPRALILTADLPKLSAAEVAQTLKADPLGSRVPIFLALEEGVVFKDKMPLDGKLPLPFLRPEWDKALAAVTPKVPKVSKKAA